jgi:hypothetical protein
MGRVDVVSVAYNQCSWLLQNFTCLSVTLGLTFLFPNRRRTQPGETDMRILQKLLFRSDWHFLWNADLCSEDVHYNSSVLLAATLLFVAVRSVACRHQIIDFFIMAKPHLAMFHNRFRIILRLDCRTSVSINHGSIVSLRIHMLQAIFADASLIIRAWEQRTIRCCDSMKPSLIVRFELMWWAPVKFNGLLVALTYLLSLTITDFFLG